MSILTRPTAAVGGIARAAGGPVVDWGFNFRAQASYRVDGANQSAVTNAAAYDYPSQEIKDNLDGSVDAGWVDKGSSSRDRSLTSDPRLAGVMFWWITVDVAFRVDWVGDARVSLALGDYSSNGEGYINIWDGAIGGDLLLTLPQTSTSAQNFLAADGVVYSANDWVVANDALTARVMLPPRSASYLTFNFPVRTGSVNAFLAHIRVEGF